eukprot:GHVS01012654.1.p1 GENE.GHVS01012654.1~~GHVS01012654.1.p1  ORF type:complete len:237 (-),score=51.75 GHVS01012654.1:375-1085(-)
MRLVFSPHPVKMMGQPQRKTEMDVSEEEKMGDILDRAKIWLSLWVEPQLAQRGWQLHMTNGTTNIDTNLTAGQLNLTDGQTLHVSLLDDIPTNVLDQTAEVPDVLSGEPVETQQLACMPTEEDIINYEQAKQMAMRRAREIEESKGVAINHKRILHDEAVDDYDEDYGQEMGGGFYGDMGFGHDEEDELEEWDSQKGGGEFEPPFVMGGGNLFRGGRGGLRGCSGGEKNPISPFDS